MPMEFILMDCEQPDGDELDIQAQWTQDILDDSMAIFAQHLRKPWKCDRYPRSVRQRLQKLEGSDDNDTAQIFFDFGGMLAWVAYYRSTCGESHYAGRSYHRTIMAAFDDLAVEDRIWAAKKVARFRPHWTILHVIDHINSRQEPPPQDVTGFIQSQHEHEPEPKPPASPTPPASPAVSTHDANPPPENEMHLDDANPASPVSFTPSMFEDYLTGGEMHISDVNLASAVPFINYAFPGPGYPIPDEMQIGNVNPFNNFASSPTPDNIHIGGANPASPVPFTDFAFTGYPTVDEMQISDASPFTDFAFPGYPTPDEMQISYGNPAPLVNEMQRSLPPSSAAIFTSAAYYPAPNEMQSVPPSANFLLPCTCVEGIGECRSFTQLVEEAFDSYDQQSRSVTEG